MTMHQKVLVLVLALVALIGCGKPKQDPNGGTLTWVPADATSQKSSSPLGASNSESTLAGAKQAGEQPGNAPTAINPNASSNSKLNKATGPVENEDRKTSDGKVIPIGEREIVAVVHPGDEDKAMACLNSHQIDAKSTKDGANIDIMVLQKDRVAADKFLNADASEKHYNIHANSSSDIKPSH